MLNSFDVLGEQGYIDAMNYVSPLEPEIGDSESDNNNMQFYVSDQIAVGEDFRLFKTIRDDTSIIDCLHCFNDVASNEHEKIEINYSYTGSDLIQSKGNVIRNYANTDGVVLSTLEVRGNDLLTIERDKGISIMNEKDSSYTQPTFNRKEIIQAKINDIIKCMDNNDMGMLSTPFNFSFWDYYKDIGKNCLNFIVSFWVKVNLSVGSYIKATVMAKSYYSDTVYSYAPVDIKGLNTWQYVEMPVSFKDEKANRDEGPVKIQIKIGCKNGSGTYQLTNVRVRKNDECTVVRYRWLQTVYDYKDIFKYESIRLIPVTGDPITIDLKEDKFMTFSDLYKSVLNKTRNPESFEFVCCNGLVKYRNIKKILMKYNFDHVEDEIYGFDSLDISTVDANRGSKKTTRVYYEKSTNYIRTHTISDKGTSKVWQNMQGKIISSIDEYGKQTVNEYDEFGNLLSVMSANSKAFDESFKFKRDNKRMYLTYTYDDNSEDGRYRENIVCVKNEELSVQTEYKPGELNIVSSIRNGDRAEEIYHYDSINRVVGLSSGDLHNDITYNKYGQVSTVRGTGNQYKYDYDKTGGVSAVSLMNNNIELKLFATNINDLYDKNKIVETYPLTNSSKEIKYDVYNRPFEIINNDCGNMCNICFTYQAQNVKMNSTYYSFYQDASQCTANVATLFDGHSKMTTTFLYNYANEQIGFITRYNNADYMSVKNTDPLGNNKNQFTLLYQLGSTKSKFKQISSFDRITKTANTSESDGEYSKFTYTYEYDIVVGNVSKRIGSNSTLIYDYENTDQAHYYSFGAQHQTHTVGNKTQNITYSYDQNLNIIAMSFSGIFNNSNRYSYDSLNRISQESISMYGGAYEYTYNSFNRLSAVTQNRDRYKNYTYDNLGRITGYYKNGSLIKKYTYNGNNLYPSSITVNNKANYCVFIGDGKLLCYGSNAYTYDAKGLRVFKRSNSGTTSYYYFSDTLLGEDLPNGTKIRYMYDMNEITGVRFHKANGEVLEYEYIKDCTGSVIAVVRDSTVVAKYMYDAWGNIVYKYEDANDPFAKINPIRYKSYYYDIDIGYYYLQSRYYDPEIGAFISPDSVDYLDSEDIGGLNLYCYCNNNPVLMVDPSGHLAISTLISLLIGFAIGAVISGVAEVVTQISENGFDTSKWDWKQIGLSALGGGVAGMISAVPIANWFAATFLGGVGAVVGGLISGSVIDFQTGLGAFTIGAMAGAIGFRVQNLIANKMAAKVCAQSKKSKSLFVQKLQAKQAGNFMLKGRFRNVFKDVPQSSIVELINENIIMFKCNIWSSIVSNGLFGWY